MTTKQKLIQTSSNVNNTLKSYGKHCLSSEFSDEALLNRSGELGRALFTQDEDLLTEAARRLRTGIPFHSIIYAYQQVSVGICVHDLEIIAKVGSSEELMNTVTYIPL